MKKGSVIILSIALVIGSFTLSNILQLSFDDKVIVEKSDFEEYQTFYDEYAKVDGLREYIEAFYYKDVDQEKMDEDIIKGMFDSLGDKYSRYMTPEEFKEFTEVSSGSYPGVGIYVGPNDNGQIEISSPIEGSPAEAAGIQAGDIILSVDGVTYSGDELDVAIDNMKGEEGTEVTLGIFRPSTQETFDLTMERQVIDVKVVKTEMLDDQIGYLRFTGFDRNSSEEFISHFNELQNQGARGIVVDIRTNGGGSVSECIKIADFLLGKQPIVYTVNNKGETETYSSDMKKTQMPYVLIVDGNSASASEILSGAIKDTQAAPIVGTQTFGKGIIQVIETLDDGSGFTLTIEEYLTPNKNAIHGIGIEPDYIVEFDPAYYELEERTYQDDSQIVKAIEVLEEEITKK